MPKPPGERKGKQRGAWTETGEEAEERVARKRQRLVDACRHLAQGRRGLVITYKDIEKDFAGIEGVEVAHFGAIEGIDRWRDVDVVVIIGRPLPRPDDIERHGRRHHRQACHRRADGQAGTRRSSRPAGRADHQAQDLRRAGGRDDPAGRHRGGHRAGRRAGPGRQPDGRTTRSRFT